MGNQFFKQPLAAQPDLNASADAALAEMDAEEERNSEVKYRMAKANAYLTILNNPLFPDDAPEAQLEVEAEIREFAEMKMEIFLGMRRNESQALSSTTVIQGAELPFDEQQVAALTLWANKLLKRESDVAAPVVQRVPAAPPPMAAPIVRTSEPQTVTPAVQRPQPPAAPRRRPGRPPGTGKHQRAAAQTPLQKAEAEVRAEQQDLPEGVEKGEDGRLYQRVEIVQNGEVVQKRVLYQVPVKSLVTKAAATPPVTPADQDAPVQAVTQMRMSGPPPPPNRAGQEIAQALENAKNLFMR